jgi:tetratricopeptide (TPR) repeat protein
MIKKMTAEQAEAFTARLAKFVVVGKYKEALPLAEKALKEYPDDLVCQYQYAKLLGDWADELPPVQRTKLKKRATKILARLTRRLNGQPYERRFGICLNFYYQSSSFQAMHNYGKRFARTNAQKGFYAQALGACLLAEELFTNGRTAKAKSWAQKSVMAWQRYHLKNERYYFAHYCYAKALALSGDPVKAVHALKTAARLAKRPVSDWEFQDVLTYIKNSQQFIADPTDI